MVARPPSNPTAPSLVLSIFIAGDGFRLTARKQSLAPGCESPGQGVTVANKSGALDFAALTSCVAKLKASPAGKDETGVTLSATPETPYHAIVSVMDAVRKNADGEDLFPEVTFGMPPSEKSIIDASPPSAHTATVDRAPPTPPKTTPRFPHSPAPPAPSATTEAEPDSVAVIVSKTQILVDDTSVVPVPTDAAIGVEAQYKRSGRSDLYIVPLARALVARRERDRQARTAAGKDSSFSEAVIIADADTPYRLLMEVLYTLGQSEFAKYHLMVLQTAKK
jgi:biopolymer transport protein ExbD